VRASARCPEESADSRNSSFAYFKLSVACRGGSLGIATAYGVEDRGRSSIPGRVKNFHFSVSSSPALESTRPPIQWVPGVKRQEREADHSPPTSTEVNRT
jgi:hypothetical protein